MRFMSRPEEKRLRRYVGRNYSNAGVEAPSGGVVGYPVGHMTRGHIATGRFSINSMVSILKYANSRLIGSKYYATFPCLYSQYRTLVQLEYSFLKAHHVKQATRFQIAQ